MKKAMFGLAAALVGAAMMCGCGDAAKTEPAQNDEAVNLKYANFPPPSTFPCVQMERFKEELEKRTEGKIKITTYPGGQLLDAKAILDGVINGTADIGNFAMSYQPGRFPVTEALDLPHFFPDSKTATRALEAVMDAFDPAEFKDVVVLSVFTCPPAVAMTKTPVNTLADLKGMSIRSSGTGAEVLKRIGGTPVSMPQSEVPDALQKGLVVGNLSSAEVLKDMNYADPCPNVYQADLGVVSFAVVMNKRKFERLPKDLQDALRTLGREQSHWTAEYVDQHVEDAIAWSTEKYEAFKVVTPNDEDRAALRAAAAPLMDEYDKRGKAKEVDGKAVLDVVKKSAE
jgi:TRAP-type C4-dicarboxylate transport system substrate-binding protein